jgi:uncharacterized protein
MDISYRLGGLEFEWNADKAEANAIKHGVNFEEAAEIFLDPLCTFGEASDVYELRDYAIGYSYRQRLMFVVHIERGDKIRIISARLTTLRERTNYE